MCEHLPQISPHTATTGVPVLSALGLCTWALTEYLEVCYERNQSCNKVALFLEYKQSVEEKKPNKTQQTSERGIDTNKKSLLSFLLFVSKTKKEGSISNSFERPAAKEELGVHVSEFKFLIV